MLHQIQCPNCKKYQLFTYGETSKKCLYEGCNGFEISIVYDVTQLKRIVEDFINKDKKEIEMKTDKPQPTFYLQHFPNGDSQGFWA
jgi:hypothetical protein